MKVCSLHVYCVLIQEHRDTGSTSSSHVFSRPPPTTLRYVGWTNYSLDCNAVRARRSETPAIHRVHRAASPPAAGRAELLPRPGWAARTRRCLSPRSRRPNSRRSEPRSPRSSSSSTPRGSGRSSDREATVKTSGAKAAECSAAAPKCFTSEKINVSGACNVPELSQSLWHEISWWEKHLLLSSETIFCSTRLLNRQKLCSLFVWMTCKNLSFNCLILKH